MFLERFRNVVQAIVNKNPQNFFGLRPKKGGLFNSTLILAAGLFNFWDLVREGGSDAEHILLCGPPKGEGGFLILLICKLN